MIHRKISVKLLRMVWDFFFFDIIRLHVEGRENYPKTGAAILTPNHKSDWDPPLVGAAINTRLCRFMAKEELFKPPVFGYIISQLGAFPVRRGQVDQSAFKKAVRVLRDGHLLIIFPEGRRVSRPGLGKFHDGPATLAMLLGVPLVPICIVGSADMPKRNSKTAVLIGKPIAVEKQKPSKEKIQELNEELREAITKLHDDYMQKIAE
jgi:1-acyl-sn-glycerol-3-phosphate acyltransferase